MRHALRLGRANRGATAVEYGLIMALIVLTLMVSLRETAKVTISMWNDISNKVQTAR
ncbi:MAG: Flp family type IVb pilin [Oxalobacteraceae bacterium]|nr:MAG: Flp family type IVb pilin [Oxalobacteraceae bacterium]